MINYQTSEEHYRIAEKLLSDEQYLARNALGASTARLRELAQVHASLAAVGLTQADLDRMTGEDEAEAERLRQASAARAVPSQVTSAD